MTSFSEDDEREMIHFLKLTREHHFGRGGMFTTQCSSCSTVYSVHDSPLLAVADNSEGNASRHFPLEPTLLTKEM
jgi:hypothetical protein